MHKIMVSISLEFDSGIIKRSIAHRDFVAFFYVEYRHAEHSRSAYNNKVNL